MLKESKNASLTYKRLSKEEMAQRGILGRLVGICADFNKGTRNGRKYSDELWEHVFSDPIMQERIENHVCYGELGHPEDRTETDIERAAVVLAEVPTKGTDGKLRAVFDIIDTPPGRILKTLCDYGSILGVSSRGSGDVDTDKFTGEEYVVPESYDCEGFDIVLIPAVKEARLQYVTESLDKKKYNKSLRDKLLENLNKETAENKKIQLEVLDSCGISLASTASTNNNKNLIEAYTKQLQDFGKENKNLKAEIKKLQEELANNHLNNNKYVESLTKMKQANIQLKEQVEKFNNKQEKINELNEAYKSLKEKSTKNKQLLERLVKQHKTVSTEYKQAKIELSSLDEKLNNSYKVEKELKNKYSNLVEKYNSLLAKSKAYAKSAKNQNMNLLEKYITSKASQLGVSRETIKQILPENYSISDVDKVYNNLLESVGKNNSISYNPITDMQVSKVINVNNNNNSKEDLDEFTISLLR